MWISAALHISVLKYIQHNFQSHRSNYTSYPNSRQGKCEWRKQVAIDPPVCMQCTYTLSMHRILLLETYSPGKFWKMAIKRLNLEAK